MSNCGTPSLESEDLPVSMMLDLVAEPGFQPPSHLGVDDEVVLDGVGECADCGFRGSVQLGGVEGVGLVLREDFDDGSKLVCSLVCVNVADWGGAEDYAGHSCFGGHLARELQGFQVVRYDYAAV